MEFKLNSALPVATTLTSKGRLLRLDQPIVMGILNVTQDSFFDQGAARSGDALWAKAEGMLRAGATILDVGGESTRPGALPVPEDVERASVIPAVEGLAARFPQAWISVDSTKSAIAAEAVAAGAHIVNDISGGLFDPLMLPTVAALSVPFVAMHIQGSPQTMQEHPHYEDVVMEVMHHLRQVCDRAAAAGIHDIIIDPGFGFGKTVIHNYQLLRGLGVLRILGRPLLAGLSRKSMICRPLGILPEAALNGTTAAHMLALQQGAAILRVHDVREAIQAIRIFQAWEASGA